MVKKKLLFVMFALFSVTLISCTGAVVKNKEKSSHDKFERKVFENKQAILDAIDKLELENNKRNLTKDKVESLKPLLPEDENIEDFYQEALWLAEHEQGEHIGHSLSFIYSYIQDGIPFVCVPHEIDHLSIYIEHNDSYMINKAIEESKEGYDLWVKKSEQAKKLLPAYYKNFETLKQEALLALEKAEQKDYEGAIPHIKYVSKNQIC